MMSHKDCVDNCAFARMVTELSQDVKTKVSMDMFVWIVGGVSATYLALLILLIPILVGVVSDLNNKLDQVNNSVNSLRIEAIEKTTTLSAQQEQLRTQVEKLLSD